MHTVNVGDVFVEMWGYDQTNINAYEVVRVTPASVALKPIATKWVDDSRVKPLPGHYLEWGSHPRVGTPNARGEVLKRVKGGPNRPYLNMTSGAFRWDGERSYYETPLGMGH